jgi:hypothetical protein
MPLLLFPAQDIEQRLDAGLGDIGVLFAGPAADADGADVLAVYDDRM